MAKEKKGKGKGKSKAAPESTALGGKMKRRDFDTLQYAHEAYAERAGRDHQAVAEVQRGTRVLREQDHARRGEQSRLGRSRIVRQSEPGFLLEAYNVDGDLDRRSGKLCPSRTHRSTDPAQ